MKFKLPDAFKKPALAAIENAIEKQVEENFDKTADAVLESLKKLAGGNKIVASFIDSMAGKAKSEAKAAILNTIDKIDGVPKAEEVQAKSEAKAAILNTIDKIDGVPKAEEVQA